MKKSYVSETDAPNASEVLSPFEISVIRVAARYPRCSRLLLWHATGLDKKALKATIQLLVRRKLLRRVRSATDRRQATSGKWIKRVYVVELTQSGQDAHLRLLASNAE